MFKKKRVEWDKENLIPIIQQSICTGEMVFGFKDKKTNKFQEVCLVADNNELEKIKEKYGILDLKKEY